MQLSWVIALFGNDPQTRMTNECILFENLNVIRLTLLLFWSSLLAIKCITNQVDRSVWHFQWTLCLKIRAAFFSGNRNINPSSDRLLLMRVTRVLEPIPTVLGQKPGDTLNWMPPNHPNSLSWMHSMTLSAFCCPFRLSSSELLLL